MILEAVVWVFAVFAGCLLASFIILAVTCAVAQSTLSGVEGRQFGGLRSSQSGDQQADALLRDLLSDAEYHTLMTRGYLDVASSACADSIYRIPRRGGMVTLYEHGRATTDLCVQPADPLPGGDVVILHKLMIQANETDYVATARQYPSRYLGHLYRP